MLLTNHATTFTLSIPFPSPQHISFYFLSYSHEFAVFQTISQEPSLPYEGQLCLAAHSYFPLQKPPEVYLVQPKTLHLISLV